MNSLTIINPEYRAIQEAKGSTTIAEMTDEEVVNKTALLLKYVSMDIGYNIPQDMTMWNYVCTRAMDIIVRYYSDLTFRELKLAFELCSIGKLDEYLPKDKNGTPDRNHYQRMNAEYLAKVFNAFKRYKADTIKREKPNVTVVEKEISEDEKQALMQRYKNIVIEAIDKYKNDGAMPADDYDIGIIYDWLTSRGFNIHVNVTQIETNNALARVNNLIFEGKINKYEIPQIRKQGAKHRLVVNYAKTLAVRNGLKKFFDKVNISEIMKK